VTFRYQHQNIRRDNLNKANIRKTDASVTWRLAEAIIGGVRQTILISLCDARQEGQVRLSLRCHGGLAQHQIK
jgi:hypothetical protein